MIEARSRQLKKPFIGIGDMMKQMQIFLKPLVFLILISIVSLAGGANVFAEQSKKANITLKCDWYHNIQFLGFYVAKQKGFYSKAGLDVTIEPLSTIKNINQIPEHTVQGKYDFSLGSNTLSLAQSKGTPVVAIAATYQFGPQVFFAKKDTGIIRPSDFKGKRIVDKGDAWRRLVTDFLKIGGLTLDDVTLVKGGFDLAPFYNNEVDIWAGFLISEVILARQKGFEIVTFPAHEYGLSSLGSTIYTSEKMITENPGRVDAFLIASLKGWHYAIQNINESIDLMIELFPKMASEKQFHRFSFEASIPLIIPPGKKLGYLDCTAWKDNPIFFNLSLPDRLCDTTFLENAWRKLEIK